MASTALPFSEVRTTFILGAGASFDYGLPTAEGLRQMIIDDPRGIDLSPFRGDKLQQQIVDMQVKEMTTAFQRSGLKSIDAFLERRNEYEKTGKIAIAKALLPLELKAISSLAVCEGWYAWLFRAMGATVESLRASAVQIVTFNYDRTLEMGLCLMLMNASGINAESAWRVVEGLSICHVYGELGSKVVFNESSGIPEIDCSDHQIVNASKSIRIMSDHRDEVDGDLQSARRAVHSAERVVFLGFGFDSTNLRRIGISPDDSGWIRSNDKQIIATAYGLRGKERDAIAARVGREVWIGEPKDDCHDLLRDAIDV